MGAGETDLTAAMTAEAAMELARSSGVRAALHSALSKFDSLDAFFAAGEKPPARLRSGSLYFEEMRPDLDALGLDARRRCTRPRARRWRMWARPLGRGRGTPSQGR